MYHEPPFPEWLLPLGAVGKVLGFRVLPKGAGFEVTLDVPTGSENHRLTLTVPKKPVAVERYAYAMNRASRVLHENLPPAQRKIPGAQ